MDFSELETNLPLGEGVRVIGHHPCGLVALEKPEGILSHPNKTGSADTRALLTTRYDFEKESYEGGDSFREPVLLLNRLDSGTSGVILCALNSQVAEAVRREFAQQRVTKMYYAVVRGNPVGRTGIWTDWISKRKHGSGGVRATSNRKTMAKTRFHMVKPDANRLGLTLLKLFPQTGRTHQLRYQCTKQGLPIVGDRTYGDFTLNRLLGKALHTQRLFLHAAEISLDFVVSGKALKFSVESAMPAVFETLLSFNQDLHRMALKGLPAAGKHSARQSVSRGSRHPYRQRGSK